MTLRLLTMASLAWAQTAMAQVWDAPVLPDLSDYAAEVENGGIYYASLVGTGKYLSGGNDWGTRTILAPQGYKIELRKGLEDGSAPDPEAWSFWCMDIKNSNSTNDYIFVDNFDADGCGYIYVNAFNGGGALGGRNTINFKFTLNEDGSNTYRIEYFDRVNEDRYLGWDGTKTGENGPTVGFYADEEGSYIDWAFIPVGVLENLADAYAIYDAKVELYDLLNQAEENSVNVDDIVAIYNSEASTADDIKAATETLRDRIMNSMIGDEEADVTALYIKNADCGSDDGWEGNFGSQSAWYANDEDGALISGRFREKWTWEAQLSGDYDLMQTITPPAGKYRLEASVIAVRQSEEEADVYGVTLYADGGSLAFAAESDPISTANNRPNRVVIEFSNIGNPVTIGLKVRGTNANWVAVDNFKLTMLEKYSEADLAAVALGAKVKVMENYLAVDEDSEMPVYRFSVGTREGMTAFVERYNSNTDNSEAVINTMIAEADGLLDAVKAEIAGYKELADFYAQIENDVEEYGEYGSLAEEIGQLHDDVADQLGDDGAYEWNAEKIQEVIASYPTLIEEGVRKYIAEEAKPSTDISVLIKNRDMDEGEEWTDYNENNVLPGWSGTSPKGHTYSSAEFWNMDFNFFQDIEGLPPGKYTVSFQGYYRWGGPEEVVDGYDPDLVDDPRITAVLYGNEVETKFKDIVAGRVPVSQCNRGNYAGVDENGEECRMPSSMSDAQYFFTNFPDNYYTEATAIVGEDGHLRIGIKGSSNVFNRWVIFDSFRLRYDGNDADMYFDEMGKQADILIAKRDALLELRSLPQDIYDEVASKKAEAEELAANPETTADQCTTFLGELKALSAKLDDITAVINSLVQDYAYYSEADFDGEISLSEMSEEFNAIYNVATEVVEKENFHTECLWATTAELEAMTHDINAVYVKSVVDNAPENVSAANPFEVTPVIRYANLGDELATDNMRYWDGHVAGHVYGMVEVWNQNFDFHQTVVGLPQGYYTLTVDGCYRYGDVVDAVPAYEAGTEDLAAEVYAQQNGTIWATPLMSVCTGATVNDIDVSIFDADEINIREVVGNNDTYYLPYTQPTAYACMASGRYKGDLTTKANAATFYSDGGSVTLGVKKTRLKNGDSSVYDNFRLYYLGQNVPEGYKEGVGTAVKGAAGAGAKMGYYTIGGLQLARPQKGVNIIVTTLPDGTQTTTKVVLK